MMLKLIGSLLVSITAVLAVQPLAAKMYEPPASFHARVRPLDRVALVRMPSVDVEALRREDQRHAADSENPRPYRFAVPIDVDLTLEDSFTEDRLVGDARIWRLRIRSAGALSLNLAFTEFELPDGAKLWVYDPAAKNVEGPYTLEHRTASGQLWTPIIPGKEIVIELYVPAGATHEPKLRVGKVNHGYRSFFGPGDAGTHDAQTDCHVDVICPEGDSWRNPIRSVAKYSSLGGYLCTGQLLNNTGNDFRPYFLSAFHCVVDDQHKDARLNVGSLVLYWNFESPNCGDRDGGNRNYTQTGATYLASWAATDFVLVLLNTQPDLDFDVHYAGWDASGATPSRAVTIHHPFGDEKAISFESDGLTTTAYLSDDFDSSQNHWRVHDWDVGTTEQGSSGACLWNPDNGRCVGQLHGGLTNCEHDEPVWYGKLSGSWEGNKTPDTRLRDWLNPACDGTKSLAGADPQQ